MITLEKVKIIREERKKKVNNPDQGDSFNQPESNKSEAQKYTDKINKQNKNRPESRINKRVFPGDKSGAYQAAKSDLEARKGFKGAKTQTGAGKTKTISGLKADEKNPFVKTSVRKGRVDDLGGNIYDQPKFNQKKYEKGYKDIEKAGKKFRKNFIGPRETQAQVDKRLGKVKDPFDGFKPSKKTFKNFRQDSGFNAKKTAIKDIRASDKRLYDAGVGKKPSLVQQRKFARDVFRKAQAKQTAEFNKQQRIARMYNPFDDGDLGNPEFAKKRPKVKVSSGAKNEFPSGGPQKSASATETTKKYNQKRDLKTFEKFRKEAETAKNKYRADVQKTFDNKSLTGSEKAKQSRELMKKVKTAQNFERGYKSNPTSAVIRASDLKTVTSAAKGPKPDVINNKVKDAFKKAKQKVTSSAIYGKKSQTADGTEFLRKRRKGFLGNRGKRAFVGKNAKRALKYIMPKTVGGAAVRLGAVLATNYLLTQRRDSKIRAANQRVLSSPNTTKLSIADTTFNPSGKSKKFTVGKK